MVSLIITTTQSVLLCNQALELIPVGPSVPELSDPTGLIPGSVPYPPPSDPDDGFFRVNSIATDQSRPAAGISR